MTGEDCWYTWDYRWCCRRSSSLRSWSSFRFTITPFVIYTHSIQRYKCYMLCKCCVNTCTLLTGYPFYIVSCPVFRRVLTEAQHRQNRAEESRLKVPNGGNAGIRFDRNKNRTENMWNQCKNIMIKSYFHLFSTFQADWMAAMKRLEDWPLEASSVLHRLLWNL